MCRMVSQDKPRLIYTEGLKSWYKQTLSNGRVCVFIIDNSKENTNEKI